MPWDNDATVLTITREVFNTILGFNKDSNEISAFEILKHSELFKSWNKYQLAGLINKTQFREISQGEYVYRTGDVANEVFVIISGYFEYSKEYLDSEDNSSAYTNIDTNRLISLKCKPRVPRNLPFLRIKPGSVFGEEEGLEISKRIYSVRALSDNARLFVCPKNVIVFFNAGFKKACCKLIRTSFSAKNAYND